jgi:hypothetical protein
MQDNLTGFDHAILDAVKHGARSTDAICKVLSAKRKDVTPRIIRLFQIGALDIDSDGWVAL